MLEFLILPLGLVTVGLVAARLGVFTVAAWQQAARRREQDQLGLEMLRARIVETTKRRAEDALAWNGYRKFVIDRIVTEADGVRSFYLVAHDRKPLPDFKPGQYLTFRIYVPGREKPVIRCYSLSDGPNPNQYRVTIKRVGSPRAAPTAPPGLVSNFFHEQVADGDILDVQAPRGQFHLDTDHERPIVLLAGGVGVTPLLSMAKSIAASQSGREVLFFYGVRNQTEHAFKDELQRTIEQHANIRLVVAYSQPTAEDEKHEGTHYHHAGRVDVSLIRSYLQSTNYQFYICGPPGMMETLNKQLIRWGVAKKDVNTEAFGPATVSKVLEKSPAARTSSIPTSNMTITFSKSAKKCDWSASSNNLLELAEANGIEIESGCRAGNCGTCVVAVKSGNIRYITEHGAKLEEGTCLACIAAPDGDVVLDA